ncbi:MAG: hypothetical protein AAF483_08995 [Planctomycetota bacterium]
MIPVLGTHCIVESPDESIALEEDFGGLGSHPSQKHVMNDSVNTYAVKRGMLITAEQIGTKLDSNRVVYFDMPLPQKK